MNNRFKSTRWLILPLLAAALTTTVDASPIMSAPQQGGQDHDQAARGYFTDVSLIDQDGKENRLYSDLLKDRVVIINAMFTGCQGVCPVTQGNLIKIQKWLGPRLGNDVHLLSLTVDKELDSPERLKEYAEQIGARPGWHFLTGEPENIDFALRKLGLWVKNKEGHGSVFLIGNVPTGLWKKAHGMSSVDNLIEILDSVLDDRLKTGNSEEQTAAP